MAYYHVDMAYLHVMPDVAESEDFNMLRRGKLSEIDHSNQFICHDMLQC